MRIATIVTCAILAVNFTPAGADRPGPMVMTGLAPGTYQGPGYVTKFDGEGRWVTSSDPQSSPLISGRYALDYEALIFTQTPPSCPTERVRYRFTKTENGFRLKFISDGCGRVQQIPDIVFVRL